MNIKTFIPFSLLLLCLCGCNTYERYSESNYLGGIVTNVYGESYIEHSGAGIGRTSYNVDKCHVTVTYEDGYSKTFTENIEPIYCYKLQVNDWVDGWTNEEYRKNIETQEVELINMTRNISIAQEISKRLN